MLASTLQYNAESIKQGSKRINSITKTIHFANPGYDTNHTVYGVVHALEEMCTRPSRVYGCVCVTINKKYTVSTYCTVYTQYIHVLYSIFVSFETKHQCVMA